MSGPSAFAFTGGNGVRTDLQYMHLDWSDSRYRHWQNVVYLDRSGLVRMLGRTRHADGSCAYSDSGWHGRWNYTAGRLSVTVHCRVEVKLKTVHFMWNQPCPFGDGLRWGTNAPVRLDFLGFVDTGYNNVPHALGPAAPATIEDGDASSTSSEESEADDAWSELDDSLV